MVKKMKKVLDTYIDIDATPQQVWKELINFSSWKDWNPFIPSVEGKLEIGKRMIIQVAPPEMKPMTFKPKVFEVEQNKKIVWGGSFLWIVYRGDHAFCLEPLNNLKTRFRQIEQFKGPIVLLMGSMIKKTEVGYHQMNQAFKNHVEKVCNL